ncbi:O-antigen ligase family protein [Streptomyces cynarae]|uniref:O-antigen ligase family protein n=1 Tax=Streptomyces cynarae TaxID=2981134 RepID=UPI00406D2F2E
MLVTRFPGAVLLTAAAVLCSGLARHPRLLLALWLSVLALVPFWLTVESASLHLPPATIATILLVPALLHYSRGVRPGVSDVVLCLGCAGAVLMTLFGAPQYAAAALITQGGTSYAVGRILTARVGTSATFKAIAVITVIVSAWSLAELATGIHVFQNLQGAADLSFWNQIQVRGSLARSEAAWGHAIALGAFISMGIPMIFASGLKWTPALVIIAVGGTLATLSRGPILGAVIALSFCFIFVRFESRSRRLAIAAALTVTTGLLISPLLKLFAGVSSELDTTSAYRAELLTHAIDDLKLFGRADHVWTSAEGRLLYRGFGSIDNAYLLMALDLGLVVTSVFAAGLGVALWRTIRFRGSAADLALASQIPVLFTVAMITQYQAALFFVAGAAVSARRATGSTPPASDVSVTPTLIPGGINLPPTRAEARRRVSA